MLHFASRPIAQCHYWLFHEDAINQITLATNLCVHSIVQWTLYVSWSCTENINCDQWSILLILTSLRLQFNLRLRL